MGFLLSKSRNQALKLFKRIENNDNPNPATNGEMRFLSDLLARRSTAEKLTILDCGANMGEWTASCREALASHEVEVHLFEPSHACVEALKARFGSRKDVHINPVGVSDRTEKRLLYSDAESSSLSSLYQRRITLTERLRNEEPVEVVRLDEYLARAGIAHIHLLKLDIEGHELHALRGLGDFLAPEKVDAIQFEYGGANVDAGSRLADFYELLSSRGFVMCKIMPRGAQLRSYASFMENFMYSNYAALAPAVM